MILQNCFETSSLFFTFQLMKLISMGFWTIHIVPVQIIPADYLAISFRIV